MHWTVFFLKGEIIKNGAKQINVSLAVYSTLMSSTTVCSFNKLCPRIVRLCSWQDFSTRRDNSKTGQTRFMFLWHCSPPKCPLLLCAVETNYVKSFQVTFKTKQMDWRTRRRLYALPSRSIKMITKQSDWTNETKQIGTPIKTRHPELKNKHKAHVM